MLSSAKVSAQIAAVIIALGITPSLAYGVEPSGMRGLQIGPLGEGPAFTKFGAADGEAMVRILTIAGEERSKDVTHLTDGKVSSLAVGTGFALNPNFNFVIQLVHDQTSLEGDLAGTPVVKSSVTHDETELVAGPSLWLGNVMIGAYASILAYGEASTKIDGDDTKISAATLPIARLFGGFRSGAFTGMARFRLYNDVRATIKSDADAPPSGQADVKRRSAAETSLDGRLDLDRQLAFAGSVTFVGADQASDGAMRDYLIYGFGGLYTAAPWIALTGGIQYTEPHYAKSEDASIFADNLGGMTVNLGTHYTLTDLTGNFGLGYTIPKLATYTDKAGDKIELERSRWDLTLGMILHW